MEDVPGTCIVQYIRALLLLTYTSLMNDGVCRVCASSQLYALDSEHRLPSLNAAANIVRSMAYWNDRAFYIYSVRFETILRAK